MQMQAPALGDVVIRLSGVSKTFRVARGAPFRAVDAVDLEIHRGDVFGLVGRSGAGKSTLLRLINLLERPDGGRVEVAGQDLVPLSAPALRAARRGIGMIFQQFNLLQNASVFDNVAFPLKIHGGYSTQALRARVLECLEVVGLADKRESYPAQLSGGQKQRVAIARALAPEPQVLLCDEPTSALDSETTRSLLDTLRIINETLGVTIVLVSHDLDVVRRLCRHVAIIEDGRIAERFSMADLTGARRTRTGRALIRLANSPDLLHDADDIELPEPAATPEPVIEPRHAVPH
ncbi:methionine ABC transporter ATP-binding protein [soil metagenome]